MEDYANAKGINMIRKRQIQDLELKTDQQFYDELRNGVIEEVAREIEKFTTPFGKDTVNSFAVYIRGLKK
jgi:hypothetical protein